MLRKPLVAMALALTVTAGHPPLLFAEEPVPAAAARPQADTKKTEPQAEPDARPADPSSGLEIETEEGEKLRLPLGFKPKKRGKYTVYCRKESVMGTRFPVETCYDETRIREYLLVQRENQEQVDQMRRICSSQAACGAN